MRFMACLLMAMATGAHADLDRISFLTGSYHAGASQEFNETNPGVFLSFSACGVLSWDAGIYLNSFSRVSVSATATAAIFDVGPVEVDGFAGLAWYPQDGRNFDLHLGDVIPIAGLRATYADKFLQITPGDTGGTDAIISFGMTWDFN